MTATTPVGPFTAHWESFAGTVGIHVAKIAAQFQLDVEDKLASILPAAADDAGDDDRPVRRRRYR